MRITNNSLKAFSPALLCFSLCACCLPPAALRPDEVRSTYSQTFVTNRFITRMVIRENDAKVDSRAHFTMESSKAAAAVVSNLPTGVRPLYVADSLSPLSITTPSGDRIVWLTHPDIRPAAARKRTKENAWDAAHAQSLQLRAYFASRSLAGTVVSVITEPDLEIAVPYTAARGCKSFNVPDDSALSFVGCLPDSEIWPVDASQDVEWNTLPEHTGLREVSNAVWNEQPNIIVAHLDTGYDPEQVTLPEHIGHDLEADFLSDPPRFGSGTAIDPGLPSWSWLGALCNNTHGTGTLSILAGNNITVAPQNGGKGYFAKGPVGAAPQVQIVPVRIANSVVHLYSVSMGLGIFHATSTAKADVVSVSAGGLPSQLWADAVNVAYDSGVVIAAATGDNFHGLPTRQVVWPARFRRVVAVAGVTPNDKPYDFKHSNYPCEHDRPCKIFMEGSYGPAEVMNHAVAAYGPNMPWARWQKPESPSASVGMHRIIDLDGGGTSAATPQVAGAAALYIAKYKTNLVPGWQRTQTVKDAILLTARMPNDTDQWHIGHGILDTNAMIKLAPDSLPLRNVQKEREDTLCFSSILTLLDLANCNNDRDAMLVTEVAQLLASGTEFETLDWDSTQSNDAAKVERGLEVRTLLRVLRQKKNISNTLRARLNERSKGLAVQ